MPTTHHPALISDILAFWFTELTPEQWFRKDAGVDDRIRARFAAAHETMAATENAVLLRSADTALAAIIALDQFPRNMFRDSPQAFATDAKALALATTAVDAGLDRDRTVHQRLFVYLPFEHAEHAATQARSLALIASLGDAKFTRYADAHKVIIDRFGRFPHRNVSLGRVSTPAELAFLKEPMSSF